MRLMQSSACVDITLTRDSQSVVSRPRGPLRIVKVIKPYTLRSEKMPQHRARAGKRECDRLGGDGGGA